jgi:hypothetical protein
MQATTFFGKLLCEGLLLRNGWMAPYCGTASGSADSILSGKQLQSRMEEVNFWSVVIFKEMLDIDARCCV